jgi:hypothetical protein
MKRRSERSEIIAIGETCGKVKVKRQPQRGWLNVKRSKWGVI